MYLDVFHVFSCCCLRKIPDVIVAFKKVTEIWLVTWHVTDPRIYMFGSLAYTGLLSLSFNSFTCMCNMSLFMWVHVCRPEFDLRYLPLTGPACTDAASLAHQTALGILCFHLLAGLQACSALMWVPRMQTLVLRLAQPALHSQEISLTLGFLLYFWCETFLIWGDDVSVLTHQVSLCSWGLSWFNTSFSFYLILYQ